MILPAVLAPLRGAFTGGAGYLSACTSGLWMRPTHAAIVADLERGARTGADPARYDAAVVESRAAFARLVGVAPGAVAIGSQTSVLAALIAANLPDGAQVLCAEGDFSSVVLPFVHAGRGIRIRTVPLAHLAEAIDAETTLVAFSIVQSATGEVADAAEIIAAARRHRALTFADATQAIGWLPVDATLFDALVCHSYKWLCAPRGVAFLALSDALVRTLRPVQAGWFAGEDPWSSCYGADVDLAGDARRFDVSPAWQAFVGAAPALTLFADADRHALHRYTTGMADEFRRRLDLPLPERPSAIVAWHDPNGQSLADLRAAGIVASGRAGRARVAFHIFNDEEDVTRAAQALGR
ncbi:aminotransferase class V-fold PLP-dependent enzyme [Microbacterium sp. cx-59]|uniref:aminotransferase class V-fold PLP-dependent enzyme n=1 Tax=Microbacterium sp. cx-59 TaxID=2891207 RepID=UPI001E5CCB63|nr:aminotransferase class V-fold PLP-dependent enzyme [Microbacterium sp. cx-59]MCC4907061.1 aminotransferase class V-fold PLP-dependent enzyme [Microbacterium sp. cx-59]